MARVSGRQASVQSTDFSRAVLTEADASRGTRHCPTKVGTLNARLPTAFRLSLSLAYPNRRRRGSRCEHDRRLAHKRNPYRPVLACRSSLSSTFSQSVLACLRSDRKAAFFADRRESLLEHRSATLSRERCRRRLETGLHRRFHGVWSTAVLASG